jgi:hypothetical protein
LIDSRNETRYDEAKKCVNICRKEGCIMAKRMTWKEIQETYPDQWVGLTDVERNGGSVHSAVVKYTDKTADELYDMQISGQGIITKYTTPETFPYGQVLIWGCGDK